MPLHPGLLAQGPQGLADGTGTPPFDLCGHEKSNDGVFAIYARIRLGAGNGFFSFIFVDMKRDFQGQCPCTPDCGPKGPQGLGDGTGTPPFDLFGHEK